VTEPLPENKFEPVRANRWIFVMPGADAFLTKAVHLPNLTHSHGEVVQMMVEFHNVIGSPINTNLLKMLRSGESFEAELKYLDEAGSIVDRWIFHQASLAGLSWSSLDYAIPGKTPLVTFAQIELLSIDLEIAAEG
jgi:hypothetical protein